MRRDLEEYARRPSASSAVAALTLAAAITFAASGPAAAAKDTSPGAGIVREPDAVVVGRSATGRPILAKRQGNPNATRVLLVIGQMHGDEPKGPAVVRSLRQRAVSATGDVAIWTISTVNPDGQARGTRGNARSVDLNRNYPTKWRRLPKGRTYSGPRSASEPETKAVMAFVRLLRPDAIMSFHQPLNTVMTTCDAKARPWVLRIGKLAGLPVPAPRSCPALDRSYPGTFNKWYTAHFPGWFATVELQQSSAVSDAKIRRYVDTVVKISALIEDKP